MADSTTYQLEHAVEIDAPADLVYALIADVEAWPRIFPPTVYIEREPLAGNDERIRLWATANGTVKSWTSRRTLDPRARRVNFRQEVSAAPVASMGGSWLVNEATQDSCWVRLLHDFAAVSEDADDLDWISRAVDTNSRSELASLKAYAEQAAEQPELTLDFTDTIQLIGAARDVYDFLNEAQLWDTRLPHVARVALTEEQPGLQVLEMDTRTKDGSTHTTKSIRVCFPERAIVYKQTQVPALMTAHTGRWSIRELGDGIVEVSSQHAVVLNPAAVTQVLGPAATIATARQFVHGALSGNSSATLGYAREFAESRALARS